MTKTWRVWLPCILLWAACADDTTSVRVADDALPDVALDDVPLPEPETHEDPEGEAFDVDQPELSDEVLFCETDEDCPSEMCIRLDAQEEERICTTPCITDNDCPEAWTCVPSQLGRDRSAYCFPFDFCWDPDEDGYGIGPGCFGPDCDNENPDVHPGAPEFCNGIDNNCSGVPDDNPVDVGLPCETGFAGRCAEGRTKCVNGVLECEPLILPEAEEVCDGRDNTCDGFIDADADGDPLTMACFTVEPDQRNVGRCQDGVRTCVDGVYELRCVGEVLPREERCNGIDDNCDGVVDNDPIDVGGPCDTGLLGRCAAGVWTCDEGTRVCVPLHEPAEVERCDTEDWTCDGEIALQPDGSPITEACYSGPEETRGEGRCSDGVRTCEGGTWSVACAGEVLPREERCNGEDDDCDGVVDNDPLDVGGTCDTGLLGRCAVGSWACSEEGERVCIPLHAPAAEERCDLEDWTCDGQIDVQPDGSPLTQACYSGPEETRGEGRCSDGVRTCEGGTWSVACAGEVLPREERCNGEDDDCDGVVDNDPLDVGGTCDTGLLGRCAVGSWACSEEGERVCIPLHAPAAEERCDLEDWTCDGQIDVQPDGSPITQACYSGPAETRERGRCSDGVRVCDGGVWPVTCPGEVLPGPERCDAEDWSCSGDPLTPTPPDAPLWFQDADQDGFGNPSISVRACSQPLGYVDNALDCNDNDARIRPGAVERCDGLDNNCDGLVDAVRNSANQIVSVCPGGCSGAAYSAGNGFMFCRPGGGRNQAQAAAICAGQGLALAYFDNQAEYSWAFAEANRVFGSWGQLWIGGYPAIVGGVRQFFWAPGDPFTYTAWASNEPNNQGGNENCVEIDRGRGWNDNSCGANRNEFICRTPRP